MHATELDDIARQIWSELERRCCSLLSNREQRPGMTRAATRQHGAAASGLTSRPVGTAQLD
jgi:hypothetical protein